MGSGFSNRDYEDVGATILDTIKAVYDIAEMIVKVKEPIEIEYDLIKAKSDRIYVFPFCLKRPNKSDDQKQCNLYCL